MDDYQTKRRFRQRKLTRQGYYERRRQRSRARRNAEQEGASGQVPPMKRIVGPENLIRVFQELKHHGGHSPGPDGISYDRLGNREIGQIMRDLSEEILTGRYEPSEARRVRIPKARSGYRTLSLRSILDRVVASAISDAVGSFLDPIFLSGSHGHRPGRSVWTLLLDLERILVEQQRFVLAQDDIRQAFDHVPIDFALRQYRRYIPDEALLILIKKILRGHCAERQTGIDQGSALSPLTLNLVLHHALDLRVRGDGGHSFGLRYADNLVFPCRNEREGLTAIQEAQSFLQPHGMTLKGADGPPVDLRQRGAKARILGLAVRWEGQIHYDLTTEAWNNLRANLSDATISPTPHETAKGVISGWLGSCAPALEGEQVASFLDRILSIAAEVGFREVPRDQLKQQYQSSLDRWNAYKRRKDRKADMRYVPKVSIGEREQDSEDLVAPLTMDRPGIL